LLGADLKLEIVFLCHFLVFSSEEMKHECWQGFVCTIVSGFIIHSDGSAAYRNLEILGYQHKRSVHFGSGIPDYESMSRVHHVAALLQR
jgi:hypothetical protein